jgi:hypothetical protein
MNEPRAATITVRVRELGGFEGAILAQTTQDVEQIDNWIHFDFAYPAVVVPENIYLISVQATNPSYGWMRAEGNRYPRGNGGAVSGGGTDFMFRTYAGPPAPALTTAPSSLEAPSSPTSFTAASSPPELVNGKIAFDIENSLHVSD